MRVWIEGMEDSLVTPGGTQLFFLAWPYHLPAYYYTWWFSIFPQTGTCTNSATFTWTVKITQRLPIHSFSTPGFSRYCLSSKGDSCWDPHGALTASWRVKKKKRKRISQINSVLFCVPKLLTWQVTFLHCFVWSHKVSSDLHIQQQQQHPRYVLQFYITFKLFYITSKHQL